MTDFQSHPGRPEHPDFFRLVDAILRIDGAAMEGHEGFAEVLAEMADVDADVAIYIAMQRGLRASHFAKATSTGRDLQMVAAGAWLDGFTTGVLSEKNRAS